MRQLDIVVVWMLIDGWMDDGWMMDGFNGMVLKVRAVVEVGVK